MTGQPIATRVVTPHTRPWSAVLWQGDRWATGAVGFFAALALGYKPLLYLSNGNAPWVASFYQSITLSASDVGLLLIALLGWIGLRGKAVVPTTAAWFTAGAGVVLIACLLASATGAQEPSLSILCAARVGVGLLATLTIARRPRLARAILIGGAVVLLIQVPIVALQIATQSTFPVGRLLDGWEGEATAAMSGTAVVIGPDGTRWLRAAGTFPHPNILGAFAALAIICGLPWLVRGGYRRIALLGVGLAGWITLLFSFSRTAWLAAAIGGTLWGLGQLGRGRRRRILWLIAPPLVAVALGCLVAGAALRDRITPSWTEPATIQRLVIGIVALEMVHAHPLRGVGAGNFALAELLPPYNAVSVEPAHIVPLLVTAEAGIFAGLAWLALIIGPVLADIWQRRRVSIGRLAIPAALLTLASFDHYFWTFASGQALFWLGLGVWLAGGGLTASVAEAEAEEEPAKGFGREGRWGRWVETPAGGSRREVPLRGLGSTRATGYPIMALPLARRSPRKWTSRRSVQPGLQSTGIRPSTGSSHADQAVAPED
jgi:hypothetical protein